MVYSVLKDKKDGGRFVVVLYDTELKVSTEIVARKEYIKNVLKDLPHTQIKPYEAINKGLLTYKDKHINEFFKLW